MSQRREFFKTTGAVLAAMWAGAKSALAQQEHQHQAQRHTVEEAPDIASAGEKEPDRLPARRESVDDATEHG